MSNKLEKTIAELKSNIAAADKEWEARKGELEAQYNREFGFYVGRVDGWKKTLEMLTAPEDEETEKKEVEPEVNESAPETTASK